MRQFAWRAWGPWSRNCIGWSSQLPFNGLGHGKVVPFYYLKWKKGKSHEHFSPCWYISFLIQDFNQLQQVTDKWRDHQLAPSGRCCSLHISSYVNWSCQCTKRIPYSVDVPPQVEQRVMHREFTEWKKKKNPIREVSSALNLVCMVLVPERLLLKDKRCFRAHEGLLLRWWQSSHNSMRKGRVLSAAFGFHGWSWQFHIQSFICYST